MSIPLVRLFYMDLLRGFVAVGRRMSITLAAQDLCLTQSAVSRQVLALEAQLGVKLLVRGHRSITFTPEGESLFRSADSAVQQLQDVLGTLLSEGRRPVTVSASVGVTGLWLLPRLGRFRQHYPEIDLRIAANNHPADLRSEGVDLAIRYCAPSAAPPGALHLFGETVAPVAHPALGLPGPVSPQTLAQQCLLEFDGFSRPALQWGEWWQTLGWGEFRPTALLRFNQYDQVIQAAVARQGVALGRLELLRPWLATGQLVVLDTPQPGPSTDYAYWLLHAAAEPRQEVREVSDWIRSAAASPDEAAGFSN